ncbi:hypothetical protein AVEN_113652-1 [Araneus ventricosus]|uniref:ISXO2-like transposase domain-containing protein n=1 Tax=Araneus ventricosus TaxID=182803 RepID=A0A4Y1ZPH7_ARAVE|nr:hypothetical protein AVEN_113652-1 [Araneus ventricosus]
MVEERNADILLELIKRRILPGTTVISDCRSSYRCLSNESYQHLNVNHKLTFKDPETGAQKNSIEGIWSTLKRSLQSTNHVTGSKKHPSSYLGWVFVFFSSNNFVLLSAHCLRFPKLILLTPQAPLLWYLKWAPGYYWMSAIAQTGTAESQNFCISEFNAD